MSFHFALSEYNDMHSFLKIGAFLLLFFLLFFLLQSAPGAAQERYYLLDAETKAPVVAATGRLKCLAARCRDSSVVVTTGADGAFTIPFALPVAVKFSHTAYTGLADTIRSGQQTFTLVQRTVILDPIVATAQFTPRRAGESLYKVRTIDAEQIRAQAASTLQELMDNEMNVRINQDPVLGGSMSIQG